MKRIALKSFKITLFAMMVMLMFVFTDSDIYASTTNVSVSSATVEEGEEVSVSVTISSDEKIAAYNIMLTYDSTMLEYVSGADGGGSGAVQLLNEIFENTSVTRTLKFTAKKAGSVAINVDTASSSAIDMNVEDCELAITNGKVTINAHVEASNNNYLSKLVVAGVKEDGSTAAYNITQRTSGAVGFSKTEVEYRAYVANNIVKFAVTAVAEDANATVSIEGVELEEGGSNETTITVTAENGEKRVYTIYTYRVESETETTTPEPESESQGEENTTVNPENPGTPEKVDKEVVIGNDTFIVTDISDDVTIPEGFSTFEYVYDGQAYIAAKGEAKKLTIMQLIKKDTEDKALYIYDETNNIFYKFVNIQIVSKMYTVVEKPENVVIPEGYTETLVNIGGEMLNVWANSANEGIYMFYGMNWNGEEGLYLYDDTEKTVMRYLNGAYIQVSGDVTPNPSTSANNANKEDKDDDFTKSIIMFVEFAIILILIIALIIVILKKKESDDEGDGPEDDDLEDDELEYDELEDDELEDDELENDELEDDELEDDELEEDELEDSELEDDELEEDVSDEDTLEEESEELELGIMGDIEDLMDAEGAEEPEVEEPEVEEPEVEEPEVEEPEVEEPEAEEPEIQETDIEEEVIIAEALSQEMEEAEEQEEIAEKENMSIEDMLKDSSTSLNEEELDWVLDKLLGDE